MLRHVTVRPFPLHTYLRNKVEEGRGRPNAIVPPPSGYEWGGSANNSRLYSYIGSHRPAGANGETYDEMEMWRQMRDPAGRLLTKSTTHRDPWKLNHWA